MSSQDPSYYEPEDERRYLRVVREIESLLQKRPIPSPLDFPNKSDITFLAKHMDAIEDNLVLFTHNNNLEQKRLEKHEKLNGRFSDNSFPQHASSSSSSRRNLTNSHSPMHNYPAPSRERERAKQNAFTPNPYLPKTPTRRRSSKVPTVQAASDEEFDVRSQNRKRSRPTSQISGKKPASRRKITETGRQTPDSNSGTPTVECTTPVKPVNNRITNIKDSSQASPGSSVPSPLSSSALGADPSVTSNLLKVLDKEAAYCFNAPQFHDPRPKPAIQQDFSKAKGTFSVPIQTFQSHAEAYLRPIVQNDLTILTPSKLDYGLLVIPPSSNSKDSWEEKPKPKAKAPEAANNASLDSDFFTQRLYSSFLPILQDDTNEQNNSDEEEQIIVDEVTPEETHSKLSAGVSSVPLVDARVKHELVLLGLIQENSSPKAPFDEITMQLMRLQTQYKDLNRYNNSKKMRLRKMATDHLAYQDYTRLMDAFDSKLETAYSKRQTAAKSRRKKPSAPVRGVPEGIMVVLEQRSKFCSTVGKVFNPETLQLPKASRYADISCPPSLRDFFSP
ncbi:Transcriptional regulator [Entomophthora muscae]|uniref:Transcriptional regulator n=1 Tax=Entomophthora muscae TaxID=34485 RepID=A0ACC2UA84_9FUNG|nr:Transcriptional regulator [Entomophthora muscae]